MSGSSISKGPNCQVVPIANRTPILGFRRTAWNGSLALLRMETSLGTSRKLTKGKLHQGNVCHALISVHRLHHTYRMCDTLKWRIQIFSLI